MDSLILCRLTPTVLNFIITNTNQCSLAKAILICNGSLFSIAYIAFTGKYPSIFNMLIIGNRKLEYKIAISQSIPQVLMEDKPIFITTK